MCLYYKIVIVEDGAHSPDLFQDFEPIVLPRGKTSPQPKNSVPITKLLGQQYITAMMQRAAGAGNTFFKAFGPLTNPSKRYEDWRKMVDQYADLLKTDSPLKLALVNAIASFINDGGLEISIDPFNSTVGTIGKIPVTLLNQNDYLGLRRHPLVIAASQASALIYGSSAAASAFIGGTTDLHIMLQENLTKLKGRGRSDISTVLFPSGYMTNLALMNLIRSNGTFVLDKKVHQSLHDGSKKTDAGLRHFDHNDMDSLETILKELRESKSQPGHIIGIVVDAVYSMDGDICPLPELFTLAKKYDAFIVLDEAHSTGALGKTGHGLLEKFGIDDWENHIIIMGTLGKSLGAIGGFVTARKDLIRALTYTANPEIFSTALTPASVGAALMAIKIIEAKGESMVQALIRNTAHLKSKLLDWGIDIGHTDTQIIPILIGGRRLEADGRAFELSNFLLEKGFYVPPVVRPAVIEARLRVGLSAGHTTEQLDRFLSAMKEAIEKKMIAISQRVVG